MQPGSQLEKGKIFLAWSVQVVCLGMVVLGVFFMVKTGSSFICRSKRSLVFHGFVQRQSVKRVYSY